MNTDQPAATNTVACSTSEALECRFCRMPQLCGRGLFILLAVGKADQFKLHSPWSKKVDPHLPGVWSSGPERRLAQKPNAILLQVIERNLEIVNIEGKMMASDIAVFRKNEVLIRRLVLEDLEVRAMLTPEKTQPSHNCTRMDVKMRLHPVVLGLKGTKLKDELAADHVHKKAGGLLQVRHGEADMLRSSQTRYSLASRFALPGSSPFNMIFTR